MGAKLATLLALVCAVGIRAQGPPGAVPRGLDQFMPVPETNPMTTEVIELGRRLFFDRRLSVDGSTSCATCHEPNRAFSDARPVAVGVFGREGRRNAPAIVNRGYGKFFFWDGRASSLEEQVTKPIDDPNELGSSLDAAAARVGIAPGQLRRALASYVRSIRSGDSAFDRYVDGDQTPCRRKRWRAWPSFGAKAVAARATRARRCPTSNFTTLVLPGPMRNYKTTGAQKSPAMMRIAGRSRRRRCVMWPALRPTCTTAASPHSRKSSASITAAAGRILTLIQPFGASISLNVRRERLWCF